MLRRALRRSSSSPSNANPDRATDSNEPGLSPELPDVRVVPGPGSAYPPPPSSRPVVDSNEPGGDWNDPFSIDVWDGPEPGLPERPDIRVSPEPGASAYPPPPSASPPPPPSSMALHELRRTYSDIMDGTYDMTPCVLLCFVGMLLTVILLPLSFSYVEYHEFGLLQRKSTGKVDASQVYGNGRYLVGPDYKFLKYRAEAHNVILDDLSVFSSSGGSNTSIGLEFLLDIDFTYRLIKHEIGNLHTSLASSYDAVITSRAKDAIKNDAIFITFNEFFQSRVAVEARLKAAVEARWLDAPAMPCTLDQFHLGRIKIPEAVARKQLETKLQNERNDKEDYLQQAVVERELTKVAVNQILLEKEKTLREARATADLNVTKAKAEAQKIILDARIEGLKQFVTAGFTGQDDLLNLDYVRALKANNRTALGVTTLTDQSGAGRAIM